MEQRRKKTREARGGGGRLSKQRSREEGSCEDPAMKAQPPEHSGDPGLGARSEFATP